MTRMIKNSIIFSLLIMGMLFLPMMGYTQQKATVEVAGVSCPFCAFGLEKKLKQLPGVEKVTIKIHEGKADIEVAKGQKVTQEQIEQAVKEAGFTPGKIEFQGEKEKTR